MREETLYKFWVDKVCTSIELTTCNGHKIVVLSKGLRNINTGPDFLNAVLLINNELKVGDIEFHINEKDWFLHKHQHDKNYSNVILHVLLNKPETITLNLPTLLVSEFINLEKEPEAARSTAYLLDNRLLINLAWERLFNRAEKILTNHNLITKNNLSEITPKDFIKNQFVELLFDCLGYSQNRIPMRTLANLILTQKINQNIQVEDLMLKIVKLSNIPLIRFEGILSSNFLNRIGNNEKLSTEENDSQKELILNWVYSVRPANSPMIRVIAACKLLHKIETEDLIKNIFKELITTQSPKQLEKYFACNYNNNNLIGFSRINEIIINCVLPVGLAAGIVVNNQNLIKSVCVAYKNSFSLQSNKIIRTIESKFFEGKEIKGAFRQQGAIQFYQKYYSSPK